MASFAPASDLHVRLRVRFGWIAGIAGDDLAAGGCGGDG
jgi:hypothetical protein